MNIFTKKTCLQIAKINILRDNGIMDFRAKRLDKRFKCNINSNILFSIFIAHLRVYLIRFTT